MKSKYLIIASSLFVFSTFTIMLTGDKSGIRSAGAQFEFATPSSKSRYDEQNSEPSLIGSNNDTVPLRVLLLDAVLPKKVFYRQWLSFDPRNGQPLPSQQLWPIRKLKYSDEVLQSVETDIGKTPPSPGRLVRWEPRQKITITADIGRGQRDQQTISNLLEQMRTALAQIERRIEHDIRADIEVVPPDINFDPSDGYALADITLYVPLQRWSEPRGRYAKAIIEDGAIAERANADKYKYTFEAYFGIGVRSTEDHVKPPKPMAEGVVVFDADYRITKAFCNANLAGITTPFREFFEGCLFGSLGLLGPADDQLDTETKLDLLRTIYSESLKLGMTLQEAGNYISDN